MKANNALLKRCTEVLGRDILIKRKVAEGKSYGREASTLL